MKKFKIRCSQIGKIMANDTSGKRMGKTCESYLKDWIKSELYAKDKVFTSKYTDKGNLVEQDSIDFIADQLNYGMLFKNEKSFENDYLKGTPDIITRDTIIDAKNSWDCFTFPILEDKINKDYYLQGQGYMDLVGIENYKLVYCLTDTPEDLIIKEAQYDCNKKGIDLDDKILNNFIKAMTYKGTDNLLKIKVYEFKKDQELINSIYERVEQCREYIESIIDQNMELFNKIYDK
ncbi:MAG: hypothetical protein IPO16_14750 [Saprospiraceae bacterium]|nr:hypothetical protein [Saprospiraceae bacterium]